MVGDTRSSAYQILYLTCFALEESLTWDDACDCVEEGLQGRDKSKAHFPVSAQFTKYCAVAVATTYSCPTPGENLRCRAQFLVPDKDEHASRAASNLSSVTVHSTSRHRADLRQPRTNKTESRLGAFGFSLHRAGTTGAFAVLSRLAGRFGERRRGEGAVVFASWLHWPGIFLVLCLITSIFMSHSEVVFIRGKHHQRTAEACFPGFRFPPSGS